MMCIFIIIIILNGFYLSTKQMNAKKSHFVNKLQTLNDGKIDKCFQYFFVCFKSHNMKFHL